jgi:dUTP pyrophosphatase
MQMIIDVMQSLTIVFLLAATQIRKPQALRLKVKRIDGCAPNPAQANAFAAGYDLFNTENTYLRPHETKKIRTGICVEIPTGYFGMIRPRGSAMVRGMTIQGTIDSDYRGEIFVVVHNTTDAPIILDGGKAVAQMILVPYLALQVDVVQGLSSTDRDAKGFGSTGNA